MKTKHRLEPSKKESFPSFIIIRFFPLRYIYGLKFYLSQGWLSPKTQSKDGVYIKLFIMEEEEKKKKSPEKNKAKNHHRRRHQQASKENKWGGENYAGATKKKTLWIGKNENE